MVEDESTDVYYKVVLLGDSGCGKTALLTRYSDNYFSTAFASTIGVDFRSKTVDIDGKQMKLQFWDTAGQERFRGVVTSYHRSVNGAILVYDITNRESFSSIATWKNVVNEFNPHGAFAVVIIGNKCELEEERQVSYKEGHKLARSNGSLFFETSAKENINVEKAFTGLARSIKDCDFPEHSIDVTQISLTNSQANSNSSSCKC